MDKLDNKLSQLEKALKSWKESLEADFTDLNRDAAIQRFEFTFELLWKTIKIYLDKHEGVECYSPKSCFREIRNILNISDSNIELCLEMATDRNFSTHTYSEKMAKALYKSLKNYHKISDKIFNKIKDKEKK